MPKEINSKPKQTRKRVPRTCAQCRKRKQKCDSLKPCAVCRLRGEADLCDYEGAQPTRILDEDENSGTPISTDEIQFLRNKIDEMELIVRSIVPNQTGSIKNFNGLPSSNALLTTPYLHETFDQHWNVDLEEFNPALSLCDLMVNRSLVPVLDLEPLIVEKVRRQLGSSEETQPIQVVKPFSELASSGLTAYFKNSFDIAHYDLIQAKLPSQVQTEMMIEIYKAHFYWFHSCLDVTKLKLDLINLYLPQPNKQPQPQQQQQQNQGQSYPYQPGVRAGQEAFDDECRRSRLIKMGWVFAICRMAIWKMSFKDCLELKLPFQDQDRIEKAKEWFQLSLICLKCSDYETYPRIESVNCLILLLEQVFFDQPDPEASSDLSLLFDLKCKLIYLGYDLALNRDPALRKEDLTSQGPNNPPSGTTRNLYNNTDVSDLQQRRMIWWALLSIDGVYSDLMGRMSSIIGLESVDVAFPQLGDKVLQNDFHQGCEKGCSILTPANSIKPKICLAYSNHEIARLPSQRNPLPTRHEIKQAHEDLIVLESNLHQNYKFYPTQNNSIDRSRLVHCSTTRRDSIYFYMRYHYLFVKLHRGLHFTSNQKDHPHYESLNNNNSGNGLLINEKRKRGRGRSSSGLNHSISENNNNKSSLGSVGHPFHRTCVVDHALSLLDLRKLADFSVNYVYGNFVAFEASFSLALDYLNDPRSDRSSLIRRELEEFYRFIRSTEVPILRKGYKILESLIEAIDHQDSMMITNNNISKSIVKNKAAATNNNSNSNSIGGGGGNNNSGNGRSNVNPSNDFIDWFSYNNYGVLDLDGKILVGNNNNNSSNNSSISNGKSDENSSNPSWAQGGFQQGLSQQFSFDSSNAPTTELATSEQFQQLTSNNNNNGKTDEEPNPNNNLNSLNTTNELGHYYNNSRLFPSLDLNIRQPVGTAEVGPVTSKNNNNNENRGNGTSTAQPTNWIENHQNQPDLFGNGGGVGNRENIRFDHRSSQALNQSHQNPHHPNKVIYSNGCQFLTTAPNPIQTQTQPNRHHSHHHQQQQNHHHHPYHLSQQQQQQSHNPPPPPHHNNQRPHPQHQQNLLEQSSDLNQFF